MRPPTDWHLVLSIQKEPNSSQNQQFQSGCCNGNFNAQNYKFSFAKTMPLEGFLSFRCLFSLINLYIIIFFNASFYRIPYEEIIENMQSFVLIDFLMNKIF